MTAADFRRIALGLRDTSESAHHSHPDFRVNGRIFASLGYPDEACGMVKLTPEHQRAWVRAHPGAFVPVAGKWGDQGCTTVRLAATDEETLGEALTLAWQTATASPTRRVSLRKKRPAERGRS